MAAQPQCLRMRLYLDIGFKVSLNCALLCDPTDGSLPSSSVHGVLEYYSRLPFPSPGISPTQGLNPGLLHCRQTLYHLIPGEAHFKVIGEFQWGHKDGLWCGPSGVLLRWGVQRHACPQRSDPMSTQREGEPRRASSEKPNRLTPWSWAFSLQNCQKTNFCRWSHSGLQYFVVATLAN